MSDEQIKTIRILLDRMSRGVLLDAERDLLRTLVLQVIDQVSVIRDAARERANLLEEARDELSAAGQNGAHGDDWPAVAPAIRALSDELNRLRPIRTSDCTCTKDVMCPSCSGLDG